MAKNIKCNSCDNPATVHLTQIVNNQIHKVDLCEKCAKDKGVADPGGFSISDMFSGELDSSPGNENELTCSACGFTHADFRRNGRFGCATCYLSFETILEETLEGMHSGTHHRGKVPQVMLGRLKNQVKIERVERSLNDAVAAENYEAAARFRDQLSSLRAEEQSRSSLHSNQ
tara:strand:+ start:156 stop:674 length:519 start_codon:yes stop_codon:yes gene_type:complete